MKSWKGILLALLILASFAGCSRSATSTPEDSAAESQSAQAETSTEAESTEAEQPEPEPLPTFTFGGVEFYPILLSEDTLTSLDTTEGTLPGERSETVSEIKAALFATYGDSELQFVSHTQARPEVLDYYDTHLQTLVETLYTFCQLEPQTSMSEQTVYLLDLLPTLPEEMQQDIYTVYKAQMIEADIDGSLLRDGSDLGLYYVAQTDPDWRDYPFPNAASPNEVDDTAYDRACGVMSMTMVGSTYLHRELDPTDLIDYVQENGYRITVSGVDDTFMTDGGPTCSALWSRKFTTPTRLKGSRRWTGTTSWTPSRTTTPWRLSMKLPARQTSPPPSTTWSSTAMSSRTAPAIIWCPTPTSPAAMPSGAPPRWATRVLTKRASSWPPRN